MYQDRAAIHLRLTQSGSSESYQEVARFKLNLQPADGAVTALTGGIYGQTYTGFTSYAALEVGDAVTLEATSAKPELFLRVKAVRRFDSLPLPHTELTLILPEA